MFNHKTKIGYISKSTNEQGRPCDFKLHVDQISQINIRKTKTTYKINGFRGTYQESDIISLEEMKKDVGNGLIMTSEMFVIDEELENYLQRVVDDWNTNGTAKSVFDE